jgi:hypothetical protein
MNIRRATAFLSLGLCISMWAQLPHASAVRVLNLDERQFVEIRHFDALIRFTVGAIDLNLPPDSYRSLSMPVNDKSACSVMHKFFHSANKRHLTDADFKQFKGELSRAYPVTFLTWQQVGDYLESNLLMLQPTAAIAAYKESIALYPENEPAWRKLVLVYQSMNNTKEAKATKEQFQKRFHRELSLN